jgi:glycosyltransferase involved in cell wall biosynthesis
MRKAIIAMGFRVRRHRKIREHRERLLKELSARAAARNRNLAHNRTKKTHQIVNTQKTPRKTIYARFPAFAPCSPLAFVEYADYKCSLKKPLRICHVLESLGIGGAQTMAMELIHGLNKYFGDYCTNSLVYLERKPPAKKPGLLTSYDMDFEFTTKTNFAKWCETHKIDIVVQHRISQSQCLHNFLPVKTKYILINHTWNSLSKLREFMYCDYYVSVCQFLHQKTKFPAFVHNSRKIVILNGVENDYINKLPKMKLDGTLRTGRCHRLVSGKFKLDSLDLLTGLRNRIPGLTHHLIGCSSEFTKNASKYPIVTYYGHITSRSKKMSIIQSLDVYYYNTYSHEGASVAVLESLACGVPVLCKNYGGNHELIQNGVNGYIGNETDFTKHLLHFSKDADFLQSLKQRTLNDFNKRLHIRHTASKYMQLFESCTK